MDGRQQIAQFLAQHESSQAQFARDVGCSESHLTLFLQGKRKISVPLAMRMSAATGGAVPLKALVSSELIELAETLGAAE